MEIALMSWYDIAAKSFTTLFVTIDPIGIVPLFLALTPQADRAECLRVAKRAIGVSFMVLIIFAVFGAKILLVLGISLPAFRIAGGLLLFAIALEMLFEKRTERRKRKVAQLSADDAESSHDVQDAEKNGDDVAVFPLAVPLIAGPGAITSLLLLVSQNNGNLAAQGVVIAVMTAMLALTFVLFLAAGYLSQRFSAIFVSALTRILGVILAALAIQFVLTGLHNAGF